jgi:SAM-dependent methyltransferase
MTQAANLSATQRLDAAWYPEFEGEWDARAFRQRVLKVIGPETRMLDIGAGRGATSHMQYKGMVAELVGVDVDPVVLTNTQVDRAVHTPDGLLTALESDYFDVVISKDVLEHVEQPDVLFAEIARVLKPGGLFLAKTPNGTHYVPVIARLTPLSLHKTFNKLRGRDVVDTFPTRYRANSRRALTSPCEAEWPGGCRRGVPGGQARISTLPLADLFLRHGLRADRQCAEAECAEGGDLRAVA